MSDPTTPNAEQVEAFVHPMVRAYVDAKCKTTKDECEQMVRAAHQAITSVRNFVAKVHADCNPEVNGTTKHLKQLSSQLQLMDRMSATKLGLQRLAKELGIDLNG
jgi:hypothetical protein